MIPLPQDVQDELSNTARTIVADGKGILAADESTNTIGHRFSVIDIPNNEENRRDYRSMLFTTPDLGKYISGCILCDETVFQENAEKVSMIDLLGKQNIIPGIKVDLGQVTIPCTENEKATQGLDGLSKRCDKYYRHGCRFAKWRATLTISKDRNTPSRCAIFETCHTLARYAAMCQENRIVPIVEPEILTDGSHSIEECGHVMVDVLSTLFKCLHDNGIFLEGCLLKPNMVTPGSDNKTPATPDDIASHTLQTLYRTVPGALGGVTFLSGGQSEEDATLNLNAMNRGMKHKVKLTFSYGRALQSTCIKTWKGKAENCAAAQKVLLERAKANHEAALGIYQGGAGGADAKKSNFQANYTY